MNEKIRNFRDLNDHEFTKTSLAVYRRPKKRNTVYGIRPAEIL